MILHHSRTGKGHPLIILHGLYGSGENWLTIARGLSSLCEIILVDQRNHGQSFHSPVHSYPAMVEDLERLMDHLELESAMILGHSMGGRTAVRFALDNPGRVSGLIVADISPFSGLEPERERSQTGFHRSILDALNAIDLTLIQTIGQADQSLSAQLPDKRLRQFLLKNLERNPDGTFRWKLNLEAIRSGLGFLHDGLDARSESLPVSTRFPVLFIRGDQSDYVPDSHLGLIRKVFPFAGIETIKNAGHWLHAEQPEVFLSAVRRFLVSR